MRIITIIICLLIGINMSAQDTKPTLIYVGDPMCSWCYGFAPELEQVVDRFSEQLDLELVMGGLRPYNQETMTDLKSFLTHHWEDVHKASGQAFEYGILDRSDLAYDTEPPSRAAVVVRQLDPDKELAFFKQIQVDFYKNNKDLSQAESYHDNLKNLGLDTVQFDQLFNADPAKQAIRNDFERARQFGVSSFPTMLLQIDDEVKVVAKGYRTSAAVISAVESLLD